MLIIKVNYYPPPYIKAVFKQYDKNPDIKYGSKGHPQAFFPLIWIFRA